MLLKSSTILCVPGGPGCMMPSFSLLDICGGGTDVEYGVESRVLQKGDVARRRRGAHGSDVYDMHDCGHGRRRMLQ
jgi:hypothetical protein